MSLIDTIRRADRVIMLSDGAGLNEADATLHSVAPKVFMLPTLNAAIGIRGNAMVAAVLFGGISADSHRFASYDGLKGGLIDHLKAVFAATASQWKAMQGPTCLEMDFIVAGISETTGPDSYLLRTIENTPTPAWEILDTGSMLLTPCSDVIHSDLEPKLAGPLAPYDLSDDDLIAAAEMQRGYIEPLGPNKIPTSWVGGFLQLTTVTEREIATRIIHRWDDRVGERIRLGFIAADAA